MKDIKDVAEALQGAKNIIAEWVNEDQKVRTGDTQFVQVQGDYKFQGHQSRSRKTGSPEIQAVL
jgi:hypothetical protein